MSAVHALRRFASRRPSGRKVTAAAAAIALTAAVAVVVGPSAAQATTSLTVNVIGGSYYGSAPAFAGTTSVSGVTVTGITCTTATNNATFSTSLAAGIYAIKGTSCSGGVLSDPNYTIGSYSGGQYQVLKVGLTVTADNKTRAYGAANPTPTYTATGWVNGDTSALLTGTPSYSTTATATSDVGTYPITIAAGTLHLSSNNYYVANYVAGTLTIAATPLTVTVIGGSFYGTAPAFAGTTSVSGVTVSGVTCAATTTAATFSPTLNAGTYSIDGTTCSGGALSNADYYIGTYTGSNYVVYRANLTVTADDKSRAYGSQNPALTYTITGFVNGETAATAVTGVANVSTTATAASAVGTYPISVAVGTLKATNYTFAAFTAGTLTVGARSVAVTVTGANFYGSAPAFAGSTAISGLTVSGTITCTSANGGAAFSSTLTAGNYTVDGTTCSGGTLSDPNFVIGSYNGSTYVVFKDGLNVTATDKSRAYGSGNPALTYSITGFVNGENSSVVSGAPNLSTTALLNSNVGTYPITPVQGTLTAANYYFNMVPGTLTITAAQVTVTVVGSSFYGGAPAFAGSTGISGLTVSGVTCTSATGGATLSTTLNAGNYTIDGTTCSGGTLNSSNFAIAGYSGSSYTVFKVGLTVTADDKSRAYGSQNPTFTYQLSGFVNGDDASVVTGKPTITTTATPSSTTGTYPITPSLGTLKATNYYFGTFTPGTLTIAAASVTVTVAGANFYGSAPAFGATTPISGLTVSGVACTKATDGSTFSATLTAGSYTVDGTTCSGGVLSDPNFTIAGYSGTFYVVYKLALTVTPDNQSRSYATSNPTFTYQVSGFVNGDTASVVTGAPNLSTTATSSSDIGTYPITATLGTLKATNYYFAFSPGTLTITPYQTVVTVAGAQFYGSAPAFAGSTAISGLTVTGTITCTTTTSAATINASLTAGNYTIDGTTCSGGTLSSSNFVISGYSGSFYVVYKVQLNVNAHNASRTYGVQNPTFTYDLSGFVNGDTASAVTGAPQITTTATPSSNVGTYPITPALGTLKAANYYFAFVPATLTVTQYPVTVTVAGAQFYGTASAFGGTTPVSGLTVSGVTCTSTTSGKTFNASLPAGNYTVNASTCSGAVLSSSNFSVAGYSGSFYVVYKVALTVTASNATRVYGAANPPFTYTLTGFVNGDTAAAVTGTASVTTNATAATGVGTYSISAGAGTLAAANYYFTFASGVLTVTPATLTVKAVNSSRVFGSPDPAFNYTIAGYVNGDTASVVSGAPGHTSTATAASHPGTYAITPTAGTLAANNYVFSFVAATLTIIKATPVIATTTAAQPPMRATFTYGPSNTPIVGLSVTFYLGKTTTVLCSGVLTDANGTATCHAPGFQGLNVLFQGYTPVSASTVDFNSVSKLQH